MTAKNSGKKLGKILEIESRHSYPSNSDGRMLSSSGLVRGESLIKLPQFVPMRVSLKVKFELLEKE